MFHNRSIHYSIGEMLVNRHFSTEFLQGRFLLVPPRGEVVHVCTWPGTSEEAEKATILFPSYLSLPNHFRYFTARLLDSPIISRSFAFRGLISSRRPAASARKTMPDATNITRPVGCQAIPGKAAMVSARSTRKVKPRGYFSGRS